MSIEKNIHTAIESEFSGLGVEVTEIQPIPQYGKGPTQFKTLGEAIDSFGDAISGRRSEKAAQAQDEEVMNFIVQVKRPKARSTGTAATSAGRPTLAQPKSPDLISELTEETLKTVQTVASPPPPPVNPANLVAATGTTEESIHLPNGKLNITFLIKNAQILFRNKDYGLAKNIYRTIAKSGEKAAPAHYWLGRCFEAEGKSAEAENAYQESIHYNPSIEAYQRLAALLIRNKKDQQAAETMEKALALKTVSDAIRFELHKASGNCWLRVDRTAEAEIHYKRAAQIQPGNDTVLTNLGALCLQMGRIPEAQKHFQNALSKNARNDRALSGLGSCALASGDKKNAHDFFVKSLEVNIHNPTAVFHMVKCAYEIKSYAAAAKMVKEYIQKAPVNANLLYSLAGLQFHLGRLNEAKESAAQALQMNAKHPGAQELMKLIEHYQSK
ncbi:MAG: tetratricopeptide repeat protein [Bdellovibrionales bacterium]|nr:tetratricopeptide repeat protein [Bdellovibrionales bacterium]